MLAAVENKTISCGSSKVINCLRKVSENDTPLPCETMLQANHRIGVFENEYQVTPIMHPSLLNTLRL